jgi:hypothetical protein
MSNYESSRQLKIARNFNIRTVMRHNLSKCRDPKTNELNRAKLAFIVADYLNLLNEEHVPPYYISEITKEFS